MGAVLGADKLAMQQTISVYLISYALMSMVHGQLSDAMGRWRVLIGGLMLFVLASVGCALSASLGQLLAFRALQGLSRSEEHTSELQSLMRISYVVFCLK